MPAFHHFAHGPALHHFAERLRWRIGASLVHPATHIGIKRQPVVADANLPRLERLERALHPFEAIRGDLPVWAAGKPPLAVHFNHGKGSFCVP
jgi:hypothetical protein